MMRTTTYRYDHKGWNFELSFNPFKLGTTTVPKIIYIDGRFPVEGKVRLWMIPFITLSHYRIKGELRI